MCDVQTFRRNRLSSQSMLCAQFLASLSDVAGTACIGNEHKEQTIRELLLRPHLASTAQELKEHAVTACIDSKSVSTCVLRM
jgi:Tfp pilus assembly protein PilN